MMPIALADAPRELKKRHGVNISYRKLYTAVLDGRVPAERGDNGRWTLQKVDLPAIAEALGVPSRSEAAAEASAS